MTVSELPLPPLDLLQRTGHVGDDDPAAAYLGVGEQIRQQIESFLPADWTWGGKRVLDFGCGAGRVLRQFAAEAAEGEFWGCDIDERSIAWMQEELCPPLHVCNCTETPGLPQADGYFDLIYAISVYTHITDTWAGWLLEHHRVLADGGMLLASFLNAGMSQQIAGEDWDEDRIGMNALWEGNPWDEGGPVVLHSGWWLRAHWGRLFEVVDLVPYTGEEKPVGHGLVLLRKKPVKSVTVSDLERLEPGEEREIWALQHHVKQLRREAAQLRALASERERWQRERDAALEELRAAADEQLRATADEQLRAAADERERLQRERDAALEQLRASADAYETVVNSRSWRGTAPARAAARALRAELSARRSR